MTPLSSRDRRRAVTDEPFRIAPDLLGAPLASVWRRAIAFLLDGAFALAAAIPTLVLVGVLALWWQAPALMTGGLAGMTGEAALSEQERVDFFFDAVRLVHSRRPHVLPPFLAEPVEADDADALMRAMDEHRVALNFNLGPGAPSVYDPSARLLRIRGDVAFGGLVNFFSFASIAIVYFALLGLRGRTPGKWVTGIRVRRLDGRPMTLNTSFQRAGGYSASFSTLGLGFAGAFRDPNRQTLHDRMCGTVVVREPGVGFWRRLTRRLTRRGSRESSAAGS